MADNDLVYAITDNIALTPACAKWRKMHPGGYNEMIGEWHRREVLGRGAHGVVHRGVVVRTGQSIAVKQIHTGGMRQAELQVYAPYFVLGLCCFVVTMTIASATHLWSQNWSCNHIGARYQQEPGCCYRSKSALLVRRSRFEDANCELL